MLLPFVYGLLGAVPTSSHSHTCPVFARDGESAWVLLPDAPAPLQICCAKGTIHPSLGSDTCPQMPSESLSRIPARWTPGIAWPRECWPLRVPGRVHLPHVRGSGPAPRAFVRSSRLYSAPLQSPRRRGRVTADCIRDWSPSCHLSHHQRLSMGPAHTPDATYTREGEGDNVSLK